MPAAQLVLHVGAKEVSRDELASVEAPPPTRTWFPIRHSHVLTPSTTGVQSAPAPPGPHLDTKITAPDSRRATDFTDEIPISADLYF